MLNFVAKAILNQRKKELFATDAISFEPFPNADFEKETKGLDNILKKGRKFGSRVETMNSFSVSEPIVANNSFSMTMSMDVTMKGTGRMNMTELCVYDVKEGKVVSEQFHM